MELRIYNKRPLTIEEQIIRLREQGMIITDEEFAKKILSEISYFRLAAYWRPMEEDKTTHCFKPDSTLENAVDLYLFDNELRTLVFNAIQTIEIALRTRIIQQFCEIYGAFWFMDMPLGDNQHRFLENLSALDREIQRSKDDFIKDHFRKYDKPEFPPAWKTLELATFGTLSKLYYNFGDKKVKKQVARSFNLPQHEVLESWMRSLAVLRNHCAHHSRLWNRNLTVLPMMSVRLRGKWIDNTGVESNKLYASLCCIAYWLDSMELGGDFKNGLRNLLSLHQNVDVTAMGFPENWSEEPLWAVG